MLIYGAGSIIITFLANYGIKAFRIDLILTTGAIVLGGFLICLAALKAFENNGIRFEEMQFLTRPYLGVFYGSLLIGGIGAAVDMVVTLVSSLKELVYQQPTITQKELLHLWSPHCPRCNFFHDECVITCLFKWGNSNG